MSQTREIMTAERTLLEVELAGVVVRSAAFFIDILVIIFASVLIRILLGILAAFSPFGFLLQFFTVLFTSFAFLLYFSFSDVYGQGRTLGKKLLKIRTIMTNGSPVTWRASILRSVLIFADAMPGFFGVAFLTMIFSKDSQRFGDMAAGTLVIMEPDVQTKFTPSPYKYGLHPLEENIHSLRKMTTEEYSLIKTLCDRFVYLSPETQFKMIKEIWEPFCLKHDISDVPGWHTMYLMEAVVMKYGRDRELL